MRHLLPQFQLFIVGPKAQEMGTADDNSDNDQELATCSGKENIHVKMPWLTRLMRVPDHNEKRNMDACAFSRSPVLWELFLAPPLFQLIFCRISKSEIGLATFASAWNRNAVHQA